MHKTLSLVFFLSIFCFSAYGKEENVKPESKVETLEQLKASGFTCSDPLKVEEIEHESLEEMKKSPDAPQVPFGHINKNWNEFKSKAKEGDVILRCKNQEKDWKALAGRKGLIIVRNGIIIATIIESLS